MSPSKAYIQSCSDVKSVADQAAQAKKEPAKSTPKASVSAQLAEIKRAPVLQTTSVGGKVSPSPLVHEWTV